ncbi:MAG: hypothetical protein A3K19_26125 [Lentisphaerae bacterium RIFOXYB12_FULL_65_16]|nr:MAG: hypothetical protein A3K18_00445 [Lentisphaerae bacterium RIFOXYA12_64_32]OGV87746.1 MAG: hypothetical protein A3K19_26125 [Lentisphaerae bacterium RIFOXYB12_FULL_65_16]
MGFKMAAKLGLGLVAASIVSLTAMAEDGGWRLSLGASYRCFDDVEFHNFAFRNYGNTDPANGPLGVQGYTDASFSGLIPVVFNSDHMSFTGANEDLDDTADSLAPVIGIEKALWVRDALTLSVVSNLQYYQLDAGGTDTGSLAAAWYQHMWLPGGAGIIPAPVSGPFDGLSSDSSASVKNDMDMDLFVLDLGAKASVSVCEWFGFYGAVGPTLNFSDLETSQTESAQWNKATGPGTDSYSVKHTDDDQSITLGGYAAVGLQFAVTDSVGIAAEYRYDIATDDVSTSQASVDLDGSSAQLKLTIRF